MAVVKRGNPGNCAAGVRPVVNAGRTARALKRPVAQRGPTSPNFLNKSWAGRAGVERPGFCAEAVGGHDAGGREHVGVKIPLVTGSTRRVQRHVCGDAELV
ncbi:MAG TPA: hypothetical protein PK677_16855, partial [Acidiphilium sp.]|nr:hypothetical protein [Acidiphilium sp.]